MLFTHLSQSKSDVSDLAIERRSVPRNELGLNAPINFGSYHVAPMLTRYLGQYP